MPTIISEIIDYDDDIVYEETGEPAVEVGSCPHCDTEPVAMLLVIDRPDYGSEYGRAVCLRCGHMQSY